MSKNPLGAGSMKLLANIAADARSYVRPHAKKLKGIAKSLLKDFNRILGTGVEVAEPLAHQWRRVLNRSQKTLGNLPELGSPRVLFATSYGLGEQMLVLESILGMALRTRGADPVVLACDKSLPACEWNRFGNFNPPPNGFGPQLTKRTRLERCRVCTENITNLLDILPIAQTSFSQFANPDDLDRAMRLVDAVRYENYRDLVYRDIHVGEQAYASTVRAQLRGTLLGDPETRWLFHRYLVASVLVTDWTERVFEATKPDRVVAVHGVYVTHGTICEVARKQGINVVVYGTPLRKNSIWLSHDDTYHRTLISEPRSHWENLHLSPERRQRITDYLVEKRLGGREYSAYYKDAINDQPRIRQELELRDDAPIISLFTNVLWDAQLYFRYNAFGNMLDWLFETIRYFARRDDLQLVIRIHPAEAKGGRGSLPTNQPLLPEIEQAFPELPANVKVIPSESKINSYTLAEMSHASLIYGARMGVEIAMLGTPLIVAGETFNRGKGYSYDVESAGEYFNLLDRIHDLPRNAPESVERAHKYAYHYFFRIMMDFPLFSVADEFHVSGLKLEFTNLEELSPNRCGALDRICQGILDGQTPFFYDDIGDT